MKDRPRANEIILRLCEKHKCTIEELLVKINAKTIHVLPCTHLQVKFLISENKKKKKKSKE